MQTPISNTTNLYLTNSKLTLTHRHTSISASTNSELINEVKSAQINNSHPYLLTASMQTAGRGQHGRMWQSPKGNVYLSLYLPLKVPLTGLLSPVVGYHLSQLPVIKHINHLRHQAKLPIIGIKWANDIGFYNVCSNTSDNKVIFNKLAGILIEPILIANRLKGVVIGVGMNVLTTPTLYNTSKGVDCQSISLADLTASVVKTSTDKFDTSTTLPKLTKLSELYPQIADALYQAVTHFTQMQKTHHIDGFLKQFNDVDVLKNKQVRIIQELSNRATITGIAKGIDKLGSLQLQPINQRTLNANHDNLLQIFTGRIELIG